MANRLDKELMYSTHTRRGIYQGATETAQPWAGKLGPPLALLWRPRKLDVPQGKLQADRGNGRLETGAAGRWRSRGI